MQEPRAFAAAAQLFYLPSFNLMNENPFIILGITLQYGCHKMVRHSILLIFIAFIQRVSFLEAKKVTFFVIVE